MHELSNIEQYLTKSDLFLAFKQQLLKDVEQSNFPTKSLRDIEANYHQIHQRLVKLLRDNEFSSQQSVRQLLYRIDLSETQLKKYLSARIDVDYFDVIAELIIKRVLQKVVTRKQLDSQL